MLAAQAVSLIIQSPARTQLDSAEVVLRCTYFFSRCGSYWNPGLAEQECSSTLFYIQSPRVLQKYSSSRAGVLLALAIFFLRIARSADSEAVLLEQVAPIISIFYIDIAVLECFIL